MEKFKKHLQEECFVLPSDKILVAVSGGTDSVLLCYLLKQIGQPFGIAHCNFKLRGKDSDDDEAFVSNLAKNFGVPFFIKQFDTYRIAANQKKSIQVVARELRYSWLEQIREANQFNLLATAHHLNDSVETILYNLTKGCGIRGLHGILPRKNKLIRPLLFMTKTEIRQQIETLEIKYRVDSSNEIDKYTRNFLRHNVIPNLQKINPNLEHTFSENIRRFREIESLYFQAIQTIKDSCCQFKNDELHIDIQSISKNKAAKSILFEILKPYNFTNSIIEQILKSKDAISGKLFYSNTHLAVLDRTHLIVDKIIKSSNLESEISLENPNVNLGANKITINTIEHIPPTYPDSKKKAYFDLDKLQLPLKIRKWKEGDIFYPFGMNGKRKKLSTYLRQQKLSIHDKNKLLVLESAGEIAWVIGFRTDERYRIDSTTKQVLIAEFH